MSGLIVLTVFPAHRLYIVPTMYALVEKREAEIQNSSGLQHQRTARLKESSTYFCGLIEASQDGERTFAFQPPNTGAGGADDSGAACLIPPPRAVDSAGATLDRTLRPQEVELPKAPAIKLPTKPASDSGSQGGQPVHQAKGGEQDQAVQEKVSSSRSGPAAPSGSGSIPNRRRPSQQSSLGGTSLPAPETAGLGVAAQSDRAVSEGHGADVRTPPGALGGDSSAGIVPNSGDQGRQSGGVDQQPNRAGGGTAAIATENQQGVDGNPSDAGKQADGRSGWQSEALIVEPAQRATEPSNAGEAAVDSVPNQGVVIPSVGAAPAVLGAKDPGIEPSVVAGTEKQGSDVLVIDAPPAQSGPLPAPERQDGSA
mmetsp:Transcript_43343/g.114313  ORF Transcript_43343/g.114313 Transcript_43343/m.114313 type:complete len:369 (+) Transcript_43343:119-1225(+)